MQPHPIKGWNRSKKARDWGNVFFKVPPGKGTVHTALQTPKEKINQYFKTKPKLYPCIMHV